MTARILLVDDERIALRNLEHVLAKEGHQTTATQSGAHALELLDAQPFDLVLTDMKMDKVDGMQLLRRCKSRFPDIEVIMITGFATLESAVEAMKEGAFHYIAKPFRLDEVRQTVAEALEKIRLKRENRALREQLDAYRGRVRVITRDGGMQKLLDMARQVAPTGCNVLITGESGTGKELFARCLHEHGAHPDGPFLAINCGAFNEELLANELFGHEKGAFTGAVGKTGLLVAAQGGTLFLDEVTEMSPAMQVKLLRAIQEKEVLPLGSTRPVKVDVRFIAASNRNMKDWVADGRFRQDLYYRLNVVNLHIPPLSSGARTSPSWPSTSWTGPPRSWASRCGPFPTMPWACSRPMTSPATCGNWRTSSSAAWPCARATPWRPPTCPTTCATSPSAPSAAGTARSSPWRNRRRTTSSGCWRKPTATRPWPPRCWASTGCPCGGS
jgi:two-component system response regulator HydG